MRTSSPRPLAALLAGALLTACSATRDAPVATAPSAASSAGATTPSIAPPGAPFAAIEAGRFELPWAMTFLPDGRLLVTEMAGSLRLFDPSTGRTGVVTGTPKTVKVSQGGLGDVVLHPQFARNGLVYISYVEPGDGDLFGGAVARARLVLDADGGARLDDLRTIWRQAPKQTGGGHFGYRIAFDRDGMLWISSSERQKFDPAQDMATNLGKMIRLADDGSVPRDNPFADRGGVAAQVWSLGHRNILGVAFDAQGRLWAHEMGPKGGDEPNLIRKGANYGYPIVSNGDHYDGKPIPDHPTRPEFPAPVITWNPVISPAGFVIYSGDRFPEWRGSGFIGGLSSKALVRVAFDGDSAREAERWDMGTRIREVEQGPDGALWVLEDGNRGSQGRLFRLIPRG
ncbi:PQQ-dependent sugar dehydrogenase [Lysobacter humi (ex Lee et al. 2017)]